MINLALAARNLLVQTPQVKALVAAGLIGGGPRYQTWKDGWIFADLPYATIEKRSHMALVVLSDGGSWSEPSTYNSGRFPRLLCDIWASPTRTDGDPSSVKSPDADDLIVQVYDALQPYLHLLNSGVPSDSTQAFLGRPGYPRYWGTATEIATRTGALILGSNLLSEPVFSDVRDGNGARMARYPFGVSTIS